MNKYSEAVQELDSEGFYIFKGFFAISTVEQARLEVAALFASDLVQRTELNISEPWNRKGECISILTKPTHILLDAYAKSPALDAMVENILSDVEISGVLRELAGPKIKFRGYNVQRLTGEFDPRPSYGIAANPHEWHRDSPGEIGIAIFLEDVPGPNNGATSFIRGSHRFPFCPRWSALFGPPYTKKLGVPGASLFLRWNIFSRLLARRVVVDKEAGAYGVKGDFYIFINDVWHGREPNINGRTGIKVMLGAYPTTFVFPDKVTKPSAEILAQLPSNVRSCAGGYDGEHLDDKQGDTLIESMLNKRESSRHHWTFRLARLERRFADAVSTFLSKLRAS